MSRWTVKRVKEELPPVKVTVGKRKNGKANPYVYAKLSGRLNDEATVTVFSDDKITSVNPYYRDWKFGWLTIVNALNADRPLNLD
jgi:hypothetical protein